VPSITLRGQERSVSRERCFLRFFQPRLYPLTYRAYWIAPIRRDSGQMFHGCAGN